MSALKSTCAPFAARAVFPHAGAFEREYKDIDALFDLCERISADIDTGRIARLYANQYSRMTFGCRSDNSTPDRGGQSRAAGSLPREAVTAQVQQQHHALLVRISMDWWRAHLMGDAAAKVRLQKPQGLAVLDTWQTA